MDLPKIKLVTEKALERLKNRNKGLDFDLAHDVFFDNGLAFVRDFVTGGLMDAGIASLENREKYLPVILPEVQKYLTEKGITKESIGKILEKKEEDDDNVPSIGSYDL